MDGVGRIQFSKSWYNFTDTQDIRAVVGCKAHVNHKGQVNLVCFQMPDCNHKQTGRYSQCYDGCRRAVCCSLYVAALIGQHSIILFMHILVCMTADACHCCPRDHGTKFRCMSLFSATWQSIFRVSLSMSRSCHVQMPYARVQENNWSIFIDFRGYCGARYDL